MNIWFFIGTLFFILVSASMVLIILVQRPQGGGLAGAFGGAGGGGTESVFGGRVGDALTVITVIVFVVYLALAITLNKIPIQSEAVATPSNQTTIGSTAPPSQSGPSTAIPTIETEGGNTVQIIPMDGPPPGFDPSLNPNLQPPQTEPPAGTTEPPDQNSGGEGEGGSGDDSTENPGDDDSEQA